MEQNERLSEAIARFLDRDAMLFESPRPKLSRARGDGKTCGHDLACANAPTPRVGPGKKSHDRARVPDSVPKVKVIGAGVVEIDRSLHQTQPQDPAVEIEISLRVARDGGDMVDPVQLHR